MSEYDNIGKPDRPSSFKSEHRSQDKESRENWIILAVVIVGVIAWGIWQYGQRQASAPDARETAEVGSWKILIGKLKAPSSASLVKRQVVGKQDERYLWHYLVDAQNSLGKVVRGSYLVSLTVTPQGQYEWNDSAAVMECSATPTPGQIADIKQRNGW